MNHGFLFWVGLVDKAGAAMAEVCRWLRDAFKPPPMPASSAFISSSDDFNPSSLL
jgi:hypothetical protein